MNRLLSEGDFVTQNIEPVVIQMLGNQNVKDYQRNNIIAKNAQYEDNYAVVDKDVNKIYVFNPEHKFIGAENVVTGADGGSTFVAPSMNDYLRSDVAEDLNGDDELNAKDYFTYLEQNKQRITPNGIYRVDKFRDDVLEAPGKKAKIRAFFSNDYAQKVREARSKSYEL